MTDSIERASDPEPVHRTRLLEQAFNNLSLGLIICDNKYEVVVCNKRYMEIYGLSSEQVKPGTPVRDLIQHRFNLGFKVLSKPEEYNRGRTGNAVVPGTTVHQYTDGRIISYTVYPLPDGGVRYLTYDPHVTETSCRDSGHIQAIAPHLMKLNSSSNTQPTMQKGLLSLKMTRWRCCWHSRQAIRMTFI